MSGDSLRPSLMTKLRSALHGEVAADEVKAYRRAGGLVFEDFLNAEKLREQMIGLGVSPWSAPVGQLSQLVCTWNAFVLQTLGEQLVAADYEADPGTVGYLPRVTAQQATIFLGEVETWHARAQRAAVERGYDVAGECALPAPLPRWVAVEPCPRAHLTAMLATARAVRDRAEAALADFARAEVPAGDQARADQVRGMIASADSAVAYAESLWTPKATERVHQRVEDSLKRGIETYYLAGQLLAMPGLLDRPQVRVALINQPRLALPGQPGFDPWCLTDPATRRRWRADPAVRRAIDLLWRNDPDPAATLTIQSQIDAALAEGILSPARDFRGQRVGTTTAAHGRRSTPYRSRSRWRAARCERATRSRSTCRPRNSPRAARSNGNWWWDRSSRPTRSTTAIPPPGDITTDRICGRVGTVWLPRCCYPWWLRIATRRCEAAAAR